MRKWFIRLLCVAATLIFGFVVGTYRARVTNAMRSVTGSADVDPSVIETFAVLKSPDRSCACVVTRQQFDIDFFTFTFWYLNPHTGTLMFPMETAPQIVRNNVEEGPRTDEMKLKWDGNEFVAQFGWMDISRRGDLRGNPTTGWRWSDAGTHPTTLPTTAPAK
jgi:hypothetical protein